MLPSSRKLAELLQINRNTIKLGYEELAIEDWMTAVERRGYFVVDKLPILPEQAAAGQSKGRETFEWIRESGQLPHEESLQKVPLAIDDGFPDVRLAPVKELLRECRSIYSHFYGKNFLKYGDPKGSERLRGAIGSYLSTTRGFKPAVENILITKGSQMAVYIISRLLFEIGDSVAVGNSSNAVTDSVFAASGAKLLRIPVDAQGMNVDYLEQALRTTKIKAVYIMPHHHCPTTVSLSHSRRMKLLRLAREHRFAVIEDDYDFDFHYDTARDLPLASYQGSENVIYIGSISKTFAPAVRVGFMIGPEAFLNAATALRSIMEKQGDTLLEEAMASLFESGQMESHFRRSNKIYKERRDVFCELLYYNFRDYAEFKIPEGGLAVWSEFEDTINLEATAANALKKGLLVSDGHHYRNESFSSNSLRMGFASLTPLEMEKAFDILKESIV